MKILVINGSPSGKDSITLQTVLYIEQFFPQCSFEILHAGQKIRQYERDFAECAGKLQEADMLLFCYPVYTFLAPSQLHRFIRLIIENNTDVRGKFACQISTSKHFYDITAHRYIMDMSQELGLRYLEGLSQDMEDLLKPEGRKQALAFFRYVLWAAENGCTKQIPLIHSAQALVDVTPGDPVPVTSAKRIVIAADLSNDPEGRVAALIRRFQNRVSCSSEIADVGSFPFSGGCLGCFRCASGGKCFYKDGFDTWLREQIQSADAVVYAFAIEDHSMGYRFKLFDDRQFCNGHRTVTMGRPVGYLVSGHLSAEENLRTLIHARAQVGGNYLAGIACDETDPDSEIDRLASVISYSMHENYAPPADFYGIGGMKIFRDLIYQMQGMMREDHRFYKEHGFYDFPQKNRMKIAAMYLVGAMMSNEKIMKKVSGRMSEGMIMPYRAVIRKASEKGKK